jgi:type I restriction enzyme S subunit
LARLSHVSSVRLGYVAQVQSGLTVDAKRVVDKGCVSLPYLRVANVQADRLDLSRVSEITVPQVVAAATRLRRGDVLMTEGGDLDKLGRGTVWRGEIDECLHQNHVFALRPLKKRLDPSYLSLLTRSTLARRYFEGTGVKTTNLASTSSGKIRDFRIPLPSLVEQKRFVAQANSQLSVIASLRERLSDQLNVLTERRQALITASVTGQTDVSTAAGAAV